MNQPFYVMKTDNLPSDVQYDVNHHHNHQMYGSSSAVSIHDYWYQAGPSNSWSADSMSSSSESSISVDQCEGVSSPSSSHSGNRNERIAWRPKSASSPFSSIYTPGGYLPSRDIKRKCFSSPPRSIPTWSPSQCVALDAEMVGVGQYGEDSSVARVVIVDWDGHVLFDKYIKQTQHVTDYRTFISGIKPEHLSSAKITFRDARKQILSILYGRFLIGHALKNDLKALGISHPWWLIRDTARYEPFMQTLDDDDSSLWPRKLKDLSLEKLGYDIQTYGKPHCPYEDAMAAMNLYKTVKDDWERIMRRKVSKTNEIQAGERNFQKKMAAQQQQHQWARQQQQQQQQLAYLHAQQHMLWQQKGRVASQPQPSLQTPVWASMKLGF